MTERQIHHSSSDISDTSQYIRCMQINAQVTLYASEKQTLGSKQDEKGNRRLKSSVLAECLQDK